MNLKSMIFNQFIAWRYKSHNGFTLDIINNNLMIVIVNLGALIPIHH
jgi:hypothetical protein